MDPQQDLTGNTQSNETQNNSAQLQQPAIVQPIQANLQTKTAKSNDKIIGIVIAIVGFLLVNVKSTTVQLLGIIVSVIGTYFIVKSRKASPAWSLLGLLPLIGPIVALFVKPTSPENVSAPLVTEQPIQPQKKNSASIIIWIVAGFIILGSIFFFVIAPAMLKK